MKKTVLHLVLAFSALIALCLVSFSGVVGAGSLSLLAGASILAAAAAATISMEQLLRHGS